MCHFKLTDYFQYIKSRITLLNTSQFQDFYMNYKIEKKIKPQKIHKNSQKPKNHKINKTYLKKKRISFYSLVSLQDYKSPFFSAGHVGNFVVIK